MRLGPATAPNVVANSTVLRARARAVGAARSVPAKRASRLAVLPAPKSAIPATSSVKLPAAAAATTMHEPIAPSR